jgi:hypothetical protein
MSMGITSDQPHRFCRGIGDGMYATGTRRNTGSPSGDRGMDQPESRERQAGPFGVSGRFIVPMKPGNSGGGKEPQLEVDAGSDEDGGIGDEPNNPGKCSEVTGGVARQSEEIVSV